MCNAIRRPMPNVLEPFGKRVLSLRVGCASPTSGVLSGGRPEAGALRGRFRLRPHHGAQLVSESLHHDLAVETTEPVGGEYDAMHLHHPFPEDLDPGAVRFVARAAGDPERRFVACHRLRLGPLRPPPGDRRRSAAAVCASARPSPCPGVPVPARNPSAPLCVWGTPRR